MPTFGEYIPVVLASMPPGSSSLGIYRSYWQKILDYGWAERRLDEPTVTEFKTMIEHFRTNRQIRSNDKGGRGVVLHAVAVLRFLYRQAVDDGYIRRDDDPATRLTKPGAVPSSRRALPDQLLRWIIEAADTTGNDPELDSLIIRLHIETACRVIGALSLRPEDLDPTQCLVHLREKRGTTRWQPVSPTLMNELLHHGAERGAVAGEPLLRNRNTTPINKNRYDRMFRRIGQHVHPVRVQGISAHWIRHTTLRFVERNFGKAVAKAYGGHSDRYSSASIEEVARALALLTGEPHPLAEAGDAGLITHTHGVVAPGETSPITLGAELKPSSDTLIE
ncbi:tyrosine-type recombinase/integrase [Nocardia sp. CWNU-33]|uniref:tyrosine-type recombinase/integrase n=1 Tax=Nocardia sp. CWNU-33 TaxID=3392117 RepID=UPI00398ED5DB